MVDRRPSRCRKGFTLIEMLVVVAIMIAMVGLLVPAMTSLKSAGDITKASYDVQGALLLARTYAVANHTYTWAGFFEEDVTQGSQSPAVSGVGRVVICIVASTDGTAIYNEAAAAAASPSTQTLTPTRLTQVNKLIKLNNIHIFTPAGSTDAFGQRPGASITSADRIGLSGSGTALFQFQYPLNGTAQYTFGIVPATQASGVFVASGVVQFNPQGEAISESGPAPGVAPCKEIAIQATHGKTPDAAINVAAVDIAGLTGEATLYRR